MVRKDRDPLGVVGTCRSDRASLQNRRLVFFHLDFTLYVLFASLPEGLDVLANIELAFTLAFDVEMVLRVAGFWSDWRAFLHRPRNPFDLFLAVMTSIIQIPGIRSSTVYPWLTAFQLARWYRVVLAFPRMKTLLVGARWSERYVLKSRSKYLGASRVCST